MKNWLMATALVGGLGFAAAGQAMAAVSIGGTGPLGSWTGTLTYTATNDTSATLSVSLTNTSDSANGGYLTAFVLNNPGELTAVSLTSAPNAFWGVLGLDNNNVGGTPYGQFDFGASTGNSFEGGGPPSRGIAAGGNGTFLFTLSGTGLASLNESAFIDAVSSGPGIGGGAQNFVARFRGFEDGGSDKVPNTGSPPPPPPPITDIPEPMSMALFGLGLAGLGVASRRRKASV